MENLYPLLFGLVGTGVMSLVLYAIGQAEGPTAAMVRGVGSSITTPVGGSLVPGGAVHIVAGIVFAYLYMGLGHAWAPLAPSLLVLLGLVVGLARGIAVSAVLGMLAFDQDPLGRMSLAGPGVGAIHVLGTLLYGLSLSLLYGFIPADRMLMF
ncbi:MAG TPA: hypothetical protein VKB51_14555 [bacterium]|nr:hypothetical protein [bacterium]